MRAVEPAVGAGLGRAGQLADPVHQSESGCGSQAARLQPEQAGRLPDAPEERDGQGRATVAPREEVGPRADVEQPPRQLTVVAVAGLVQLRPAVVVAAVRVGAAVEQETDDRRSPAIPTRSLPLVPPARISSGWWSSSSTSRSRSLSSTAR